MQNTVVCGALLICFFQASFAAQEVQTTVSGFVGDLNNEGLAKIELIFGAIGAGRHVAKVWSVRTDHDGRFTTQAPEGYLLLGTVPDCFDVTRLIKRHAEIEINLAVANGSHKLERPNTGISTDVVSRKASFLADTNSVQSLPRFDLGGSHSRVLDSSLTARADSQWRHGVSSDDSLSSINQSQMNVRFSSSVMFGNAASGAGTRSWVPSYYDSSSFWRVDLSIQKANDLSWTPRFSHSWQSNNLQYNSGSSRKFSYDKIVDQYNRNWQQNNNGILVLSRADCAAWRRE